MQYRLTLAVAQDLADLSQHIAHDDPSAATAMLDLLEAKCHLLTQYPEIGRRREELLPNLRSFPSSQYVIYYRITGVEIQVIRILHGARDAQAALQ